MSALAHRLDVDLTGAMEIAALVCAPGVSINTAARLIEQYARTRATEAALDATIATSDRMIAVIEGQRMEAAHA